MPGPTTTQLSHETEVLRGDVAGLKQDVASLQVTMVKEVQAVREDLHRDVQAIGTTLQRIDQTLTEFRVRTEPVVAQFQAEFPAVRDGLNRLSSSFDGFVAQFHSEFPAVRDNLNKLSSSFDGFVKHVETFEASVKWVHRFLLTWAAGTLVAGAGAIWFAAKLHSDVEHNTAQIKILAESVKASSESIKALAAGLHDQSRSIDALGKRIETMAADRAARRDAPPPKPAPRRRLVVSTISLGRENVTDPVPRGGRQDAEADASAGKAARPRLAFRAGKKDYRAEEVADEPTARNDILRCNNSEKSNHKIKDIDFRCDDKATSPVESDGMTTLSRVVDPPEIAITLTFDTDKARDDLKSAVENGALLRLKPLRERPDPE